MVRVTRHGGIAVLSALVYLLVAPFSAGATPVTFFGSGVNSADPGATLAATAEFDVVDGNLVVVLTNTSTSDILKSSSVLTALFFDLAGSPTLTPTSALVGPSSSLRKNGVLLGGAGTNIGDFWAYENLGGAGPQGQNSGIGAAGFGLFGTANFDGSDGDMVDGADYGITSAGDDTTTGTAGLKNLPLVQNSVVFTLSGLPSSIDSNTDLRTVITNVSFQYGSSLSEPNLSGVVPEPGSLWLLGSGLALLLRRRRERAGS